MKLNRIKEVLEENGISQIWLAKKLDKSFSTVKSYFSNTKTAEIPYKAF